jgi:phosphoglycerate dehydrogenase-like enzyme
MKNISILYSQDKFTIEQLYKLGFSGNLSFTGDIKNRSLIEIAKYLKNADIVAFDYDTVGKSSSRRLSEILGKSPHIKGLALNSAGIDYVDKQYCKEKGITVTIVPSQAITQAVSEQIMFLLLGSAKRIFVNGWKAKKRNYLPELGGELSGKTLGILGIDAVGEEIIKLAKPFGMRIYIWNELPMRLEDTHRKTLGEVLTESDFIVINLPETEDNKKFLSKEKIDRIKKGSVVVNLSGRSLVDEKAMFESLKNRYVDQYIYETERLISSPLQNTEFAIPCRPMSKQTLESKKRSQELWVKNIAGLAKNAPYNPVDLSLRDNGI